MNSTDWLKKSVALFSRKPVLPTPKHPSSSERAFAPCSDAPRSTHERLIGKHRSGEALKPKALVALLEQLNAIVDPSISDVEGGRHAFAVAQWYSGASQAQRVDCWQLMSEQFGIHTAKIALMNAALEQQPMVSGPAEIALRGLLKCARTSLIQRFAAFPDGVQFLIQLRADLLQFMRQNRDYTQALAALDTELKILFTTWFDVAFLELRRLSWDSPASLVEKLIEYEAVHDIKSWADVKNRLDSDRRCFGFFHPRLPQVPLIFVEVVFTHDLASSMAPILDDTAAQTDLASAKCANFYSISNTQPGLKGLGFGDSLIKQVVHALQQELPQLKIFTTLSPIPSLRSWIHANAAELWLKTPEKQRRKIAAELNASPPDATLAALQLALSRDSLPSTHSEMAHWLTQCAAHYLSLSLDKGMPLDSVARFHLGNGATVARLNWAADSSPNGAKQSYGLMVNYLYDLKRLDRNRAQLHKGKIASLSAVSALTFG